MALIRVWDNTYLNTECVGKVAFDSVFPQRLRISTTTVFDVTGQHILLKAVSEASIDGSPNDPHMFARDNFVHSEILASIRGRRDAKKWVAPETSAAN
jgi:hypothetical protein